MRGSEGWSHLESPRTDSRGADGQVVGRVDESTSRTTPRQRPERRRDPLRGVADVGGGSGEFGPEVRDGSVAGPLGKDRCGRKSSAIGVRFMYSFMMRRFFFFFPCKFLKKRLLLVV